MHDSSRDHFKKHGFAKISNLIDPGFLNEWRERIKTSNSYPDNRNKYSVSTSKATDTSNLKISDLGYLGAEALARLGADQDFRTGVTDAVGESLMRANNQYLEVGPGDFGYNWHVDFYSFSYTREEDLGLTLWIPLVPIHEQRGGLQFISKRDINGDFLYRFSELFLERMESHPKDESYLHEAVSEDYLVNSIYKYIEKTTPKSRIVEYECELGDALIFDKYTFHKSSMFLEGKYRSRSALACRFVGLDSRIHTTLMNRMKSHIATQIDIQEKLCQQTGQSKTRNQPDPFFEKHL